MCFPVLKIISEVKKMKKGFGLIYAIMTTLILSLIAIGFITVANFSTATSTKTTSDLKTYWAAESASNYNINWWINLPDDVRKLWNTAPYSVETETKRSKGVYNDNDLESFNASKMPEMNGKIDGTLIWKHASSLETPNILEIDGKQVRLMRYKAPRAGKPDQAVWVLDSYAYDPETGSVNEIMISNVYNFISTNNIGWLDYAEALNHSMYGTGINSRKGVYYEWDFRHGQCYFNDLIRFDYKSGSSKKGPTFYGRFHTASEDPSRYGSSVDNPKLFTNLETTSYPYGIFAEGHAKNQTSAIAQLNTSLFGGYERVEPMSPDNVVWSWDKVVELGDEYGIYFLSEDDFNDGDYINIRTKVNGGKTFIDIFTSADTTGTPVVQNLPASKYNTVAVEGKYGDVGIQGVSNTDFTVVTQSNNIHINGDFYLKGMETAKNTLEGYEDAALISPTEAMLDALSDAMINEEARPEGHLSLIACLESKDGESTIKRENVFFINREETLFLTAALLSYNGDVSAGPRIGTSENNDTNFYNIGSVIILDTQEETTGTNSSKFPYVLVQDKRYLDPNEPVPPVWGDLPGNTTTETEKGLNPGHGWHKFNYGKVKSDKFEQIVGRFISLD